MTLPLTLTLSLILTVPLPLPLISRRERSSAKSASMRQKEAAIVEREGELLGNAAPQTAEDYERLLLGSPHSSYLWLRYMSFQVGLTELERAREVAERALRTIEMSQEAERNPNSHTLL